MDCVEAQRLITAFVNNTIDEDLLSDFLEHIEGCEQCKEEAEVHYIMTVGLLLLDEDTTHAYNLHNEFEKHLKKVKEKILRKKRRILKKKVTFVFMLLLFILLASTGMENIISMEETDIQQEFNKDVK